jgi:hypothetical protein
MCESGDWFILHDNAPSYNATIVKQFLTQRKVTVLDHPPYSPDLGTAVYFLFPKVKSHLKGRPFASISDIQKTVTSTLSTIAKDEFHKGIQKLYDRENLCVQLEGMYVESETIKVSYLSSKYFFIMLVLKHGRHSVYVCLLVVCPVCRILSISLSIKCQRTPKISSPCIKTL